MLWGPLVVEILYFGLIHLFRSSPLVYLNYTTYCSHYFHYNYHMFLFYYLLDSITHFWSSKLDNCGMKANRIDDDHDLTFGYDRIHSMISCSSCRNDCTRGCCCVNSFDSNILVFTVDCELDRLTLPHTFSHCCKKSGCKTIYAATFLFIIRKRKNLNF